MNLPPSGRPPIPILYSPFHPLLVLNLECSIINFGTKTNHYSLSGRPNLCGRGGLLLDLSMSASSSRRESRFASALGQNISTLGVPNIASTTVLSPFNLCLQVLVQPSNRRAYPMKMYADAGARYGKTAPRRLLGVCKVRDLWLFKFSNSRCKR